MHLSSYTFVKARPGNYENYEITVTRYLTPALCRKRTKVVGGGAGVDCYLTGNGRE